MEWLLVDSLEPIRVELMVMRMVEQLGKRQPAARKGF